jgi:hypothetical protein
MGENDQIPVSISLPFDDYKTYENNRESHGALQTLTRFPYPLDTLYKIYQIKRDRYT